uniref:Endonuclease/exonuclease/phosphatase domain-containing protein n=1 Tax=Chromera velia CCMP2878 TaxID=1169474 RepID=A0A0G4HEJ0_9ALVE|eukprot:Cvel_6565.t1-p1 / transcript=Cvel_6565.t1 / gene=Cvel_6565 / organism=Chromera_velia_CCMP2878 / gene_product=hypothetical protein / transcript_product=hypothetical protein / location=Cvel_scaffold323:79023-81124(+) / protein_length=461 / sequence_SO=supercontig / SO=protein_coding / is_pseudo=false
MLARMSSYSAGALLALLLMLSPTEAFKVVTLNTLAQNMCDPKPGGMPSFTESDKTTKKNWLTDTLTKQISEKAVEFATIQEVDVGDGTGVTGSSLDDVLAWAAKEKYTAFHSVPEPLTKKNAKKRFVSVALLKVPGTCETIGNHTFRWLWCKGLTFDGVSKSINVLAGHAASSGVVGEASQSDVLNEVLKEADVVIGDMNEENAAPLERMGYTVYPQSESGIATTAKDAFIYRKLSQACENTESWENIVQWEKEYCKDLKCDGEWSEDAKCCTFTNEKEAFMPGDGSADFNTCKYSTRICGETDAEFVGQLNKLLGSLGKTKDSLSLPDMCKEIGCATKECKALTGEGLKQRKRTIKQEDMIALKAPLKFGIPSMVYPMEMSVDPSATAHTRAYDGGALARTAMERGYPNSAWPSDHFLIAATIYDGPVRETLRRTKGERLGVKPSFLSREQVEKAIHPHE